MSIDLGNYNDVASRMREFFDKYPDGRLTEYAPWRVETVGDKAFVVYQAAAYRTADDPQPGVGTAWEPFPGRTPYTRDSELQNAETSAWGRAILAIGAADTRKGIASAEEVRNRSADRESWEQAAKPPTHRQVQVARGLFDDIDSATTTEALAVVWEVAREARAKDDITEWQGAQLRKQFDAKLAELRAEQGDGGRSRRRETRDAERVVNAAMAGKHVPDVVLDEAFHTLEQGDGGARDA